MMEDVQPIAYAKTRNFGIGAVSRLGPYISRGVLSTRKIYEHVLKQYTFSECEKFVQELAWRDYWQQVWLSKGTAIHADLKQVQKPVSHFGIPKAVLKAQTGIEAVDEGISELYRTGYMHNHLRMYVAAICCNIAKCHWLIPARWMYHHLLDGDLASNQLSWQWVAGTFSSKKYFANQDNINHFFNSQQNGTFLDVDYSEFENFEVPETLKDTSIFEAKTTLPTTGEKPDIQPVDTLIFNYYNIDPEWHKGEGFQPILLLEPSKFETYPVSEKCLEFALQLSKNIPNIKVFVGEFEELTNHLSPEKIRFKEHPLNHNYLGIEEPRDWISSVKGYYPSFFGFWKKCKKEMLQ